jgi:hypothetical protein
VTDDAKGITITYTNAEYGEKNIMLKAKINRVDTRGALLILVSFALFGFNSSSCKACSKDDPAKIPAPTISPPPAVTDAISTLLTQEQLVERAQNMAKEAEAIRNQAKEAKGWEAREMLARKSKEAAKNTTDAARDANGVMAANVAAYEANKAAALTWGSVTQSMKCSPEWAE